MIDEPIYERSENYSSKPWVCKSRCFGDWIVRLPFDKNEWYDLTWDEAMKRVNEYWETKPREAP